MHLQTVFLVILREILLRGGACWLRSSVVTTLFPQSLLKELDQGQSWCWGVAYSLVISWGGDCCFFFFYPSRFFFLFSISFYVYFSTSLNIATQSPWRSDTPRDFFSFQNMNKLYVGNLSPSVTVEDLKQLFGERKLPVADQVLLKSGYAFVDFPDQNSAIKAIETLSGKCGFDKWCCWWQE